MRCALLQPRITVVFFEFLGKALCCRHLESRLSFCTFSVECETATALGNTLEGSPSQRKASPTGSALGVRQAPSEGATQYERQGYHRSMNTQTSTTLCQGNAHSSECFRSFSSLNHPWHSGKYEVPNIPLDVSVLRQGFHSGRAIPLLIRPRSKFPKRSHTH